MKPFKNKFLWNVFVSVLMLPAALLLGGIMTALILGMLGIHYSVFNGWLLAIGIICFYIWIIYNIFTGGFDKK